MDSVTGNLDAQKRDDLIVMGQKRNGIDPGDISEMKALCKMMGRDWTFDHSE